MNWLWQTSLTGSVFPYRLLCLLRQAFWWGVEDYRWHLLSITLASLFIRDFLKSFQQFFVFFLPPNLHHKVTLLLAIWWWRRWKQLRPVDHWRRASIKPLVFFKSQSTASSPVTFHAIQNCVVSHISMHLADLQYILDSVTGSWPMQWDYTTQSFFKLTTSYSSQI